MSVERSLTAAELDAKLALARSLPGIAHLILSGPSPTCSLCGGRSAPIVDGRHIDPERWCERASAEVSP